MSFLSNIRRKKYKKLSERLSPFIQYYDPEGLMWQVICEPVGLNPSPSSKNEGGVAIVVTDGEHKHEVGRVAFERKNSNQPKKKFETALKEEISKAKTTCEEANKLFNEADKKVKDLLKGGTGQLK